MTALMAASHSDERWRITCRVEVLGPIENILALLRWRGNRSMRSITLTGQGKADELRL